MNMLEAAYKGMSEAVDAVKSSMLEGITSCNLCGCDVAIDDPCFVEYGWCVDCDEEDAEWAAGWSDEHTPKGSIYQNTWGAEMHPYPLTLLH